MTYRDRRMAKAERLSERDFAAEGLIEAQDFRAGLQIIYRGTLVTILQDAETVKDRFGREMLEFQARREDTGVEGTIIFGSHGVAALASS